jgi:hypothetical protein
MAPKTTPARRPTAKATKKESARVTVENVNVPGHTTTVDAGMYQAMHRALVKALPTQPPGLTQTEMFAAVLPHLPQDLFPKGAKAGWWVKAVQLDQEAKGTIVRDAGKPLRWHRKGRR